MCLINAHYYKHSKVLHFKSQWGAQLQNVNLRGYKHSVHSIGDHKEHIPTWQQFPFQYQILKPLEWG